MSSHALVPSFPEDDWHPWLKAKYAGKGSERVVVFGQVVTLGEPICFLTGDECQALFPLISERTPQRLHEITDQIWDDDFIESAAINPLRKAGMPSPTLATALRVARGTLSELQDPVFTLKAHYNRARPGNCCGVGLNPVFKKGDVKFPGHPSYPSGHSTNAYTLAFLLATPYPHLKEKLLETAERIARNREVAGLHFRSDSLAGRWLGEQFASAILNAPQAHQTARWSKLMEDFKKLGQD
jgi:PAP2 superfamily